MPYAAAAAAAGPRGDAGGALVAGLQVQMQMEAPGEPDAGRTVSVPIPGGFITGRFDGVAPSQEEFSEMLGFMTGVPLQPPQQGQGQGAAAQGQAAAAQAPASEPEVHGRPPQQGPTEPVQTASLPASGAAGGSVSSLAGAPLPPVAAPANVAHSELGGPHVGAASGAAPAQPAGHNEPAAIYPDSPSSDDGLPELQPADVSSRCFRLGRCTPESSDFHGLTVSSVKNSLRHQEPQIESQQAMPCAAVGGRR